MKIMSYRFPSIFILGFVFCIIVTLGSSSPSFAGEIAKPDRVDIAAITSGMPLGNAMLISDRSVTRVPGQTIETDQPAVAFTNCVWDPVFDRYLVVWYNDRPGNDDIYGQLLNGDGSKFGGYRSIAAGPGADRRNPDVTHNCNFNEFLVVWEQEDSLTGYFHIFGRRVESSSGQPLDPIINLKTGAALVNQFKPKIAHSFSSGVYLAVWQSNTQGNFHGSDIVGQLIGNDGSLIGSNFYIAQADSNFSHTNPDVAYNRKTNEFLVVWQREDKGAGREDVYAKIVRPDGSIKPGLIAIAYYSVSSTLPSVAAIPTASANGRYLVTWELDYSPGNRDIYTRIVYGDGNTAPSDTKLTIGGLDQYAPDVAGSEDSGEFLVIWHEPVSNMFINPIIKGQTLDLDGQITSPIQDFGGFVAADGALAAGPLGDFLLVYNDFLIDFSGASVEVLGHLWGNRVYLPLLER